MSLLSMWAVVLLVLGAVLLAFELGNINKPFIRAGAASLCIVLSFRYLYWRYAYSIPNNQTYLQTTWVYLFLIVETGAVMRSVSTCFFLSRSIDRSPIADSQAHSPLLKAPTDVFIATYNESLIILERTTVAALAIEHPDLRVWLLDDGNRPEVRQLAEILGVSYVARHKGKHAKAGNINNGLQAALSTGRRPEFFLLLDADFAAHRHILSRTLGLFEDQNVGIVQTPQHFFNPDPIQSNLSCSAFWPDEQRLFFNYLLPAKDAWGACFCCGTSAVFRVAAFEAAGGMATETVTEDMLTTFKFGEFGYKTIYLNERLSVGLAPESVVDYVSQRSRWCLGTVQQIYTRWSFIGRGRVALINRLSFLDALLYWSFSPAFRLVLLLAPILWWLTGTATLRASLEDLLFWMIPPIIAESLFMGYLSGKRTLPLMGDVTQVLSAFVTCRTVVKALIRPFGQPFKVTAKGRSTNGFTVQWQLLYPFIAVLAAEVLSMLVNTPCFSKTHGSAGYSVTIICTLLNTAVLTLAIVICIDVPHRRLHERFQTNEAAEVHMVPLGARSETGSEPIKCTMINISQSGAALTCAEGWERLLGPSELIVEGANSGEALTLPFTVVERRRDLLTVHFREDASTRHDLIRKLFTGNYHKDLEVVRAYKVLQAVLNTLVFSRDKARPLYEANYKGSIMVDTPISESARQCPPEPALVHQETA